MTVTTKVTRRKDKESKEPEVKEKENKNESEDKPVPPRFGPMPRLSQHRIYTRAVMIFGVLIYVWYTSKDGKETTFAKQKEVMTRRGQQVDCDSNYLKEIKQFSGCAPEKCGRHVSDKLVTGNEVDALLNVAKRGMALGGSSGGASILDLHSGALSYGEKFINVYGLDKKFITATDLAIYKIVKNKIQHAIAESFGIDKSSLHLTHPTFFSKMTSSEAKTVHDEYWHIHIDKVTYESFHYTSLLYLSDYNIDFRGGRFVFVDNVERPMKNVTVEPRKGRVLMFTSGAENPHFVEKVTSGERYAITVSFTCDKSQAIKDPGLQN